MTVQDILEATAAIHAVSVDSILSPKRTAHMTKVRQTAAFLMDDMGMNYSQIARALNRAHNSAASALIDSAEVDMTAERQAQIDAARDLARLYNFRAKHRKETT
jgi:chromosomal replication initiation ATPase DnaA